MNASKFNTGILKTRAIIFVMMAVLASFLFLTNNYASVAGAPEGDELFDLTLPPEDHPYTGNWDSYELLVGDVNRDGRDDLIWNEKSQTANRIYVGLGKSDGTFDLSLLSQDHPLPGWIGYKTLTADVDGDGRDDLIWNHLTTTTNRIYVAPAKGTPEAIFDLTKPNQEHPAAGNWSGYEIFVGDVNKDGRDDLIWNEKSQTTNRIYVGLGKSDGTFDLSLLPQTHQLPGWIGYKTLTADVDGDGRDDLIWNQLTATTNRIYVAPAKESPEGDFDLTKPFQEHPIAGNWSGYEIFVGDVNRDGRDDLIWNEKSQTTNRIYVGLGKSDGTFDLSSQLQEHPLSGWVGYRTLMADVDGDGDSDLIWNQTNMDPNRTYVGLSDGINTFDLTTQKQDHPVVCCWANYSVQTADVNGDGQADLVWNNLVGGTNRTYVGLGPVLFDVFVPMVRGQSN